MSGKLERHEVTDEILTVRRALVFDADQTDRDEAKISLDRLIRYITRLERERDFTARALDEVISG